MVAVSIKKGGGGGGVVLGGGGVWGGGGAAPGGAHRARARGTEHRRGVTSDETRGIETVPAKAAEPAGRTRVERIAPRDAIRDLTSSRVGFVARLGVAQDMAPALEDTGLDEDEVGV